jgi:phosphatidylserine decarboxylase
MKIPVARDGYKFMAPSLALTLVLAWLYPPASVITGILTAFLIYFFRDFERTTPRIDGAVFASGDGLVDDIEEVDLAEFPGGRALKIGVFLSLFNCHITRSPAGGRVTKIVYRPGQFHSATDREKSSLRNENNSIVLDAEGSPILVRQIAGLIARRIVCTARIGQRLGAGERVGLIRMGSRVEVYVPLGSELRVKKGAKVNAGQSVLAIVKKQPAGR